MCEFDPSAALALQSGFPEIAELIEMFPLLQEKVQQRCRRRVKRIIVETRELLEIVTA